MDRGDAVTTSQHECIYCGWTHQPDPATAPVPRVDDDAAWSTLAETHATDCEWITTRAHRREAPPRRLHGRAAVAEARRRGVLLRAYATNFFSARNDVTPAEAEEYIAEDPGLIYLDPQ